MNTADIKKIIEAALMVADEPLSLDRLEALFDLGLGAVPERDAIRAALESLQQDYAGHGIELKQVASGYRFQARAEYAPWVNRLWEERAPRYSRALLETLAIVAYRQPITRGEIEDIRGVSMAPSILKTLTEREWVRVAGYRDVPGRPAVYTTTKEFLDYFNLKSLSDLPELTELRDIDDINLDLFRELPSSANDAGGPEGDDMDSETESMSGEADGAEGVSAQAAKAPE